MRKRPHALKAIASIALFLLLIISAENAAIGVRHGMDLCIKSVIPSLFPFLLLSNLLGSAVGSLKVPLLAPVRQLCKLPKNGETIWLIGQISGYPAGAQTIYNAYKTGGLIKETAFRMLGFCCNAGPSFIFGMLSGLFSTSKNIWYLWGVHIFSSLITGVVLKVNTNEHIQKHESKTTSLTNALKSTIRSMASICGWVIIFRTVITMCNQWFLLKLPQHLQILLCGILELTNGCHMLYNISNEGLRFILSACFLGFGGICVLLQTISVTENLGTGMYLPGKIFQSVVSFFLSWIVQHLTFRSENRFFPSVFTFFIMTTLLGISVVYLIIKKYSILHKDVV